jgi:hypothetical protein
MRRFHQSGFLQLFRRAERATAPAVGVDRWRTGSVEWVRDRHVFWGQACSFQIETHEVAHECGWRLLFVIETWWSRSRDTAVRSMHWGRLENGRPDEAIRWFQAQVLAMNHHDGPDVRRRIKVPSSGRGLIVARPSAILPFGSCGETRLAKPRCPKMIGASISPCRHALIRVAEFGTYNNQAGRRRANDEDRGSVRSPRKAH